MSKFQKIRQALREFKRSSFAISFPHHENYKELSAELEQSKTIEPETCFALFPVLKSGESLPTTAQEESNSDQFGDTSIWSKIEGGPILREKKTQNSPAVKVMKRTRRFMNETVKNVEELMANTIGNMVRINKPRQRRLRKMSVSHFQTEKEHGELPKMRQQSTEHRIKQWSERLSPKKVRKGWVSRIRRGLSPKKVASPSAKFQISAWQTPQDQQDLI